jgi:hypothetical protein
VFDEAPWGADGAGRSRVLDPVLALTLALPVLGAEARRVIGT